MESNTVLTLEESNRLMVSMLGEFKACGYRMYDLHGSWISFVNSQDLGVRAELTSDQYNIKHTITDSKKWLLTSIRYGIA